jgi:hypothetical protein
MTQLRIMRYSLHILIFKCLGSSQEDKIFTER